MADRAAAPSFFFERAKLMALAHELRPRFESAQPFPHVVIENFLPDDVALAIAAEFPPPDRPGWEMAGPGDVKHTHDPNVEKISSSNEEFFPPLTRHVMGQFYSGIFLRFVEELTGYGNICSDPSFFGCGLHSTGRGGRLMIHSDASRHPNPKLEQIVNLIYYCTPDWDEDWLGHLELWDKEAKAVVTRIAPKFNSAVLFYTGTNCYHGHPHPLQAPLGTRRNSLAAYYYTTDRVHDESYRGYRNFVDWKRTNEHDHDVSSVHLIKSALRRWAPRSFTNQVTKAVRLARRMGRH
jgi:hypothetical protein